MMINHADLTENVFIAVPEGYTNFHTDGELLCLPNSVVDKWSQSQLRWASQPKVPHTYPEIERRAKIAAELWRAKGGFSRKLVTHNPRKVTRFQFWLRNELTSLGLI